MLSVILVCLFPQNSSGSCQRLEPGHSLIMSGSSNFMATPCGLPLWTSACPLASSTGCMQWPAFWRSTSCLNRKMKNLLCEPTFLTSPRTESLNNWGGFEVYCVGSGPNDFWALLHNTQDKKEKKGLFWSCCCLLVSIFLFHSGYLLSSSV